MQAEAESQSRQRARLLWQAFERLPDRCRALLRALIAQGDPRVSVFADDWELRELPTGHWPMLSTPDALAALLHDVAATPHDPDDAHPRAARRPGTVGGGRIG